MHVLDWILVGGCLAAVLAIGVYTQRYVKSVAHFLSAGRVARRYLLTIAAGEMGAGTIIYVAMFEVLKNSGFSTWWWGYIGAPIGLLVAISGFIHYRYRETRVMTLGQFFEIRYSRNFRLFAGILAFFAGLVNFGIIPMVEARVLTYLLGFPAELHVAGMTLPTYIAVMASLLSIELFVTLSGGLITMIVTNFMEGIITQVLTMVIVIGLLCMFGWSQMYQMLSDRPAGGSFLNPFDSFGLKDFNVWYIMMGIVMSVFTTGWQNQSAYASAPLTPHEGRMGGLMGRVRGLGMGALVLLCLCAMTYLHDPGYAEQAQHVRADVAAITDTKLQKQMEIPITVSHLLPTGLKGALCAILLLGTIGGQSNHLHSWGSIFIQDVVLPFRKREFSARQHLRVLRCSIAGVALAVFVFGCFFRQTEYIMMWWSVTAALFCGGAGVAIIGGLYWKKGTLAGAWAGMLTGSILTVSGIVARQIYGDLIPLNGQQIAFSVMLLAYAVYAIVSLATCRQDFNMDRMLHRGAYAAVKTAVGEAKTDAPQGRVKWGRIIGYDENFTRGDKWIAGGLFAWSMMFVVIMVVGSLWYLVRPWPDWVWGEYWHYNVIIIPLLFAFVITPWFLWGGIRDLRDLFRRLALQADNPLDNGTIADHQNRDEAMADQTPVRTDDGEAASQDQRAALAKSE